MKPLVPSQFLDAYGDGINVVLLTVDDPLGGEARAAAQRVADRFTRYVRFWDCRIRTPEDTAHVECCRVPQYRVVVDGAERVSHVGVLDDESLVEMIGAL